MSSGHPLILNPKPDPALPAPTYARDRVPNPRRRSFICPHCEAFCTQWSLGPLLGSSNEPEIQMHIDNWEATRCSLCNRVALFMKNTIMYPGKLSGPTAPEDMPENVRDIYEEARSVAAVSARSAAALLRLALEQLVNDLEPDGTTLNDKIGRLYGRGLDPKVVQTMDVIRGFGNTAGAHVGEIDLKDDPDTVAMLFSLLLIVVEQVITRPKHVDALFDRLPAGVREAIEKRNAKAAAKNQTAT